MSAVKTRDELTPITLYGRVYKVDDGRVTIPIKEGDSYVVTLETEGLKRKDWRYNIDRPGSHFLHVDFEQLQRALHLIIKEDELL